MDNTNNEKITDLVCEIQEKLIEFQDVNYKSFTEKLIPNVPPDKIIGVRVPQLRAMAKEYVGIWTRESKEKFDEAFSEYSCDLPHKYLEENHLHGFFLEQIKDFEKAIEETERFLPFIDNWATCDIFAPKIFKKYPERVLLKVKEWIESDEEYIVRYGVGIMMSNYLGKEFKKEFPALVARIDLNYYYVKMMVAWYFATGLAKQWDDFIVYIEEGKLDLWTHNKAIQKSIESRRISQEKKTYLRSLKIKKQV